MGTDVMTSLYESPQCYVEIWTATTLELLSRIASEISYNNTTSDSVEVPVSSSPSAMLMRLHCPYLKDTMNVMTVRANRSWKTHIDLDIPLGSRISALNFPLVEHFPTKEDRYEKTITTFYDSDHPLTLIPITGRKAVSVVGATKVIGRLQLVQPTLINTMLPHGVENSSDEDRVIISWGSCADMTTTERMLSNLYDFQLK